MHDPLARLDSIRSLAEAIDAAELHQNLHVDLPDNSRGKFRMRAQSGAWTGWIPFFADVGTIEAKLRRIADWADIELRETPKGAVRLKRRRTKE